MTLKVSGNVFGAVARYIEAVTGANVYQSVRWLRRELDAFKGTL